MTCHQTTLSSPLDTSLSFFPPQKSHSEFPPEQLPSQRIPPRETTSPHPTWHFFQAKGLGFRKEKVISNRKLSRKPDHIQWTAMCRLDLQKIIEAFVPIQQDLIWFTSLSWCLHKNEMSVNNKGKQKWSMEITDKKNLLQIRPTRKEEQKKTKDKTKKNNNKRTRCYLVSKWC